MADAAASKLLLFEKTETPKKMYPVIPSANKIENTLVVGPLLTVNFNGSCIAKKNSGFMF